MRLRPTAGLRYGDAGGPSGKASDVDQAYLDEVDEFTLTIAPILLGTGKPLFDGLRRTDLGFERFEVIASPYATHLRFRVA